MTWVKKFYRLLCPKSWYDGKRILKNMKKEAAYGRRKTAGTAHGGRMRQLQQGGGPAGLHAIRHDAPGQQTGGRGRLYAARARQPGHPPDGRGQASAALYSKCGLCVRHAPAGGCRAERSAHAHAAHRLLCEHCPRASAGTAARLPRAAPRDQNGRARAR